MKNISIEYGHIIGGLATICKSCEETSSKLITCYILGYTVKAVEDSDCANENKPELISILSEHIAVHLPQHLKRFLNNRDIPEAHKPIIERLIEAIKTPAPTVEQETDCGFGIEDLGA